MLRPRITPCLLIKDHGLVKTVKFREPKYIGDPVNAVKIFNEKEADELIVLDIDASSNRRGPNIKLIAQLAAECRMPLCYGGGIKTVAQAKEIIALGVEKIAISSAAIENPILIRDISDAIGCQSIVVVVDIKKKAFSKNYEVWINNGQKNTKCCPMQVIKEIGMMGAGEVIINSIDRDGCMEGYDLLLAQNIREKIDLPLTVLGGAGSLEDISKLIRVCGVVGAAVGSLFVFKGIYKAVLINYPSLVQKEMLIEAGMRGKEGVY